MSQYLTKIVSRLSSLKTALRDNLVYIGIPADENDTLSQLVPKVLEAEELINDESHFSRCIQRTATQVYIPPGTTGIGDYVFYRYPDVTE